MINAVLLQGSLSKEKLKQALNEIKLISSCCGSVAVLITSHGGDAPLAVDFVEAARSYRVVFQVKIYEAASTAAYIALAIGDTREMSEKATLAIHRGEFNLSPTEIDQSGKVNEDIIKAWKKYDTALVEAIKTVDLGDKTDGLYATDWIRLPAEECLRRGIVQRLF